MSSSNRTLYSFPLSGHAHRIQLALSLLGLEYENHVVDLPNGEHKKEPYLSLNPEGKVPTLVDGETVVTESTAILSYLAATYDPDNRFMPADPVGIAGVQRYFAQSVGPLATGPARARLITLFNAPYDSESTIAAAHAYLRQLNAELEGRSFLVNGQLTFADVALYSYVAHAPEGRVSLDAYGNIQTWLKAIEASEGFVPMPKTEIAAAAA